MGKVSKDKRDVYYRQAKEDGYRARSAYKLIHLDEEYHFFDSVNKVADLCAAPGSWSQVCCQKLIEGRADASSDVKIVAVDLQPMSPIPSVITIQGDITEERTAQQIIDSANGKVDLVICDGAPDVTSLIAFDEFLQSQLVLAALNITTLLLAEGGHFVAKIFRARNCQLLVHQMKLFFSRVEIAKPKSSRQSSSEAFIVCMNYKSIPEYKPNLKSPLLLKDYDSLINELTGQNRMIIPFLSCGDVTGWDSDKTNKLPNKIPDTLFKENDAFRSERYVLLPPVEQPINPAYKNSVMLKKEGFLEKINCKEDEEFMIKIVEIETESAKSLEISNFEESTLLQNLDRMF
uniref:Putative tRNA (cytidine(32)/guanosine(34)-2'-O)-methyltransferase n=1 Tax=Rhabditophanes sp. KR3021 TaxID=114890 RepID=A0AC35UBS0_9BILA